MQRTGRVRIVDVAKAAGVSRASVSFAFNSPGRLGKDTTARILDVAREMGYRPHPVAKMLAKRRTMTLGILTPQVTSVAFSNPYFGMFTQGIAQVAEDYGYCLTLVSPLHGSLAQAADLATVDGFVASGLGEDHPEVEEIREAGLAIVMVDSVAFPGHASVDIDDQLGARSAAEHVLELGHKDILIIAVEPPDYGEKVRPSRRESDVTSRRMAGYRQAFAAAGVRIPDENVIEAPSTFDGGMEAFHKACDDGRPFTAVLAMSDVLAIGAMHAALERGLSVPNDISVVGFDDIDVAEHTLPPLTTVHQPIREKGAIAARLLVSALTGPAVRPEHLRLETRLVIRGSTGPAKATTGGVE